MRLSRIITAANRDEILKAVAAAPLGAQIDLAGDVRTLAQNRMMWRLLSRIADQVEHHGQKYGPEDWKAAFMKGIGKQLRFMPSLDGDGVVAIGYRSSKLTKAEMSDMVELIYSFGAQRGVNFEEDAA